MFQLSDFKPLPLVSLGINPGSEVLATERSFNTGSNYLVMAPSGKGKSTLLHTLYGLRKDYSGSVSYRGKNILELTSEDWADLRQNVLSIVFQDLRLFPQLTALENIRLKSELTGHKTEAEIRIMAEKLGIGDLMDKPTEQLSYGQRQRVAVIRALCQPFKLLLLDEPFSHLDEENTEAAFQLIMQEAEDQGAGVLLVSLGEEYPWQAESLEL